MEIVLLVAILAVAGSALFVAFTFTKHIGLLARKTDLDLIMSKAASDISGQVSALRDELNSQLERQRELIAGVENRVLGQEEQGADPQEMDTLKAALLEAEAFVARDGWGQPPRLFSLASSRPIPNSRPSSRTLSRAR